MELKRVVTASPKALSCWRGTMTRRMAVHFWPAFSVISRTTSFTRRSNRSVPGVQSGPRMAELMLSASMFTRMERRRTFAWDRMRAAVSAEPVKETMSSSRAWPNKSRAEPQTIEIAPGGKIPAFKMSSTILCVNQAVGEAGFTRTGTPDSSAGAAFSQSPQAGKLNALMKTAAPFAGIRKCCPANTLVFDSGTTAPSFNIVPSSRARPIFA